MGDLGHRLSGLVMSAGSLYAMMLVAQHTPATPPWIAPVAGALLLVVGLVLSLERRAA